VGYVVSGEGAVAKPPAILFWSIGLEGQLTQVVDFLVNFE
jgi:hypothetical protein